MKMFLAVALILVINGVFAFPQASQKAANSPKFVVEEYWKFETHGGRLSPNGWKSASRFLVRVPPMPATRRITVVSDDYSVWDAWVKGNTATVNVGVARILEDVDEKLIFKPHSTRAIKEGVLFKLASTDKHWESGPDGRDNEVSGPIAWRINEPSVRIWLTVEATIRYVEGSSEQTGDASIKQNGERTISKLKTLH